MSYGKMAQLPPLVANDRFGVPCDSCGVELSKLSKTRVVSGGTCSRCTVQGPVRSRRADRRRRFRTAR